MTTVFTPKRAGSIAAALLASTLLLSACAANEDAPAPAASGSDAGTAALEGTLDGSGASSQGSAQEAWIAAFQTANTGVTINYAPDGSGAGREAFIAGGVDFAGSDSALKDEELTSTFASCAAGTTPFEVPTYISPIALIFNVEGVDELNLDATTIASIFKGDITKWNDAAIADLNPDATLPDADIAPVHRQYSSGTTQNFTDYLGKTDPADWAYPNSGDFPVKGGEAAQGTSGLVAAVGEADGGIGYADDSQAGDLQVANIKVGSTWVKPSAEAAAKTVGESPQVDGRTATDLALNLKRDGSDGYPIVLTTYSIMCSSYTDAATGNLVKAFFSYVASADGQKAGADAAKSAPLSGDLQTKVQGVISGITAG